MNNTYCPLLREHAKNNCLTSKERAFDMMIKYGFLKQKRRIDIDISLHDFPDSIFDFTEMDINFLPKNSRSFWFIEVLEFINGGFNDWAIEYFLQETDTVFYQKYHKEIIKHVYGIDHHDPVIKETGVQHGGKRTNSGRKPLPKTEKKQTTTIRLKPSLKQRIQQAAEEKQMSFNFYIETTLENSF